MAKKQKKVEVQRTPTKRQLSKLQRQQRTQRILTIVVSVFLALIVGYIGYGYYDQQFKPLHQPVLKVNDTVYDMDYYTKALKLYGQGQDATTTSTTADNLIQIIESGHVIIASAKDLGATVSADEIDTGLRMAHLPNEKVYRDALTSQLLTARMMKDYFSPKVPTTTEQAQTEAILVESENTAKDVIDRLKAGGDFASLAKEYSLEATTKEKGGDLGWVAKGFDSDLPGNLAKSHIVDIALGLQPGTLSEPTYDETVNKALGYWLVQVTEKDPTKGAHARGILVGSRQQAEEIRAWIEAGEDFGALAKKYSQDQRSKGGGGDLGWIPQAGMPQPETVTNRVVVALASQLQPGGLSQPSADSSVVTPGGYWVVKVLDKNENRVVDDQTRQKQMLNLFETWLNEQAPKFTMNSYVTQEQKTQALSQALKGKK